MPNTRSMTRSPSPNVVAVSSSVSQSPVKSALKNRTTPGRYGQSMVKTVRIAPIGNPTDSLAEALARQGRPDLSSISEREESLDPEGSVADSQSIISYSERHEAGLASDRGPSLVSNRSALASFQASEMARQAAKTLRSPSTLHARPGPSSKTERPNSNTPSAPSTVSQEVHIRSIEDDDQSHFAKRIWSRRTALLPAILAFMALPLMWYLSQAFGPNVGAWWRAMGRGSAHHRWSTPPSIPTTDGNCLQHLENLEDWLNSTFGAFEQDQLKYRHTSQMALDQTYSRFKADLNSRVDAAQRATDACLNSQRSLSTELGTLQSDLAALSGRVSKMERIVDSVHNPASAQYTSNYLSAIIGATIIPGLTSATASYGIGLWQRMMSKLTVSNINSPPIEALMPWTEAGQCWCGIGPSVQLAVALPIPIEPSLVRLEHLPGSANYDPLSQPREIEVWVHPTQASPTKNFVGGKVCNYEIAPMEPGWACLGNFIMERGDAVLSVPVFEEAEVDKVIYRVKSNQGHPGRTCIYRVTLAGDVPGDAKPS